MSTSTLNVVSQTAEYALRAMVFLSSTQSEGSCVTTRIAKGTHVRRDYLSKVLRKLCRAGLLSAKRGASGGFLLTRAPAEITVLDVVAAVDPLTRITKCPLLMAAHGAKLCPLHARIDSAIDQIESAFRGTTIDELTPDTVPRSKRCGFPAHTGASRSGKTQ